MDGMLIFYHFLYYVSKQLFSFVAVVLQSTFLTTSSCSPNNDNNNTTTGVINISRFFNSYVIGELEKHVQMVVNCDITQFIKTMQYVKT